jgi:hypothetical protein
VFANEFSHGFYLFFLCLDFRLRTWVSPCCSVVKQNRRFLLSERTSCPALQLAAFNGFPFSWVASPWEAAIYNQEFGYAKNSSL